jgi:hypothetical protein
VVHLVNTHVGSPDRVSSPDKPLRFEGLRVRLNLSRIGIDSVKCVCSPPEVPIAYQETGGWLEVGVPPLHIHRVLVVE